MDEEERLKLAHRVRLERKAQFGTKSAAYTAAGLNSATWDRIENGQNVREDRLIEAIRTLWPASRGSWSEVLYPAADSFFGWRPFVADDEEAPDERLVEWINETGTTVADLAQRLAVVEGLLSKMLEAADGGSSPSLTDQSDDTLASRRTESAGKHLRDQLDALGEEDQDE